MSGARLGVDSFYHYFEQFGLLGKTGIDLPGEAATIMHKKENMGLVELATVSFGQSFQITPIQLITTASSIVNGGRRITPHFAMQCGEHGWDILPEVFLSGADGSRVGSYQRDHAVYFRAGSGGRKRKAGEASRLPGRRKDGDIGEAAEKLKEIYFFFFRICARR